MQLPCWVKNIKRTLPWQVRDGNTKNTQDETTKMKQKKMILLEPLVRYRNISFFLSPRNSYETGSGMMCSNKRTV